MTDDRLSAYLDGELDPAEAADVEALVARSDEHERELQAVAEARELLRALPPVEPEVTPLRRPRRVDGPRRWAMAGVAVAAVAAAIALLVLSLGGGGAGLPGLDDLVVRHAEAAEVGEGSGFEAMTATEVEEPAVVPDDIGAGMARTAVYQRDELVQVVFSDGVHDVSVFQQPGESEMDEVREGGTYRAVMDGNDVSVFEKDDMVVTVVADPGTPDMTDMVASALSTPA